MESSVNLRSFVDKPDRYYGTQQENPLAWLRNIRIIRKGLNLDDTETLFMASTLLKGSAASWWDMIQSKVKTWDEFEVEFESFFVSEETRECWWSELEGLRQGSMTVGEVQLQLEELFTRLEIKEDTMKKRYLVKALNKEMAYEVERSRPSSFVDTIKEAKRVEALTNKYKNDQPARKPPTYLTSAPSNYSRFDSSVSSASTMDRLAEDFTNALKIHMAKLQPVGQQQQQQQQQCGYDNRAQGPRQEYDGPPKCYTCNEYGHIGRYCPNRNHYNGPPSQQQHSGKGQGQ
jgi:hypothetical protein